MSLPTPGSDQYMTILFRTLLANPALEEWQLDPGIFTLIFLSLIVKKGGVIFDVPNCHKRLDGIFKTVDSVLATCESIFGLESRHLHLDPKLSPSKVQRYVQQPQTRSIKTRQPRRSRREPQGNGNPNGTGNGNSNSRTSSPRRPGLHIIPRSLPEQDGIATRYHSAETQLGLAASRRNSYITPVPSHSDIPGEMEAGEKEEGGWPEVLVVTGMEDCETPLQIKLFDLVKLSKAEKGTEMLVVWVRDEDKGDLAPAWLVDHFVLSGFVDVDVMDPPPDLPRQTLIPFDYIRDMAALLPYTHIHPPLTQHLNNLISATSTHPNLHSVMTGRFLTTLPTIVKAHRLLGPSYHLPPGWRENLSMCAQPGHGKPRRFDLCGGVGGVDDWTRKAGEEPSSEDLGEGGKEWYVIPVNVRGIWNSAVRHRVRWRESSESIMWAMKNTAVSLGKQRRDEDESQLRKKRAKRRNRVEEILAEMIEMV